MPTPNNFFDGQNIENVYSRDNYTPGENVGDDFIRWQNQFIGSVADPAKEGKRQGVADFFQNGGAQGQLGAYNASIQPGLLQAAQRVQASNPYNANVANASRGSAVNQLNQLRDNTINGPSVANLTTQRGMGGNLQGALGAGGGAGVRNQAAAVGSGLAGAGGAARLSEMMAGQGAYGQGAGNLRANDIKSANAAAQSGQAAQRQADQNSQAMAGIGVSAGEAARRNALEQYKLMQRLIQARTQTAQGTQTGFINTLASLVGA